MNDPAIHTKSSKADVESNLAWAALVLGLMIYIPIRLGDSDRIISLSLFDCALVVICAWQLWRNKINWHFFLLIPLGVIAVLGATSFAVYSFGDSIQLAGLMRETIKYIGFVAGVSICALLFRAKTLSLPKTPFLVGFAVCFLLVWAIQIPSPARTPVVVNGYSNIALGFAIIALHLARDRMTRNMWLGFVIYLLVVLLLSAWVRATGTSIAAAIFLIVIVFAAGWDRSCESAVLKILPYLLIVGFAVALFAIFVTDQHNAFDRRHLHESLAVRISLWFTAFDLTRESFPLGIGPGQFGTLGLVEKGLLASMPANLLTSLGIDEYELRWVGKMPLRFVHNTFLAMVLEWGLVGILLACALVFLIWKTFRTLWLPAGLCYITYIVPTLLLSDGLGFRVQYIIFGLATAYLSVKPSTADAGVTQH